MISTLHVFVSVTANELIYVKMPGTVFCDPKYLLNLKRMAHNRIGR